MADASAPGPGLEDTTLESMEFASFLKRLCELADVYGVNFKWSKFLEHIKVLMVHSDRFRCRVEDTDNFLTMSQIEKIMLDLFQKQKEIELNDLLSELCHISGENEIIIRKKREYLNKGIKIKNYRRCKTSVMTLLGRISYKRMSLIPSTKNDEEKLQKLGYKGLIFPLDEELQLSYLPFKMTISAMLEVVWAATIHDSFEDAEQFLKKRTNIIINDDTIRAITNQIGSIVFNNDKMVADNIWDKYPPWTILKNKQILNHTLYLKIDSTMLNTRDKSENGSYWKENKLGMAFSSNNFLLWTDKHGIKQHKILKKEFTSLIGNSADFKKLFYSLAVQNGYKKHKNVVLLSDGATWIKNLKDELFDGVYHILDYYHLCEHIYDFAKNVFSLDECKYKSWAEKVCRLFKESKYVEAVKEIKQLWEKRSSTYKFDLLSYISNNKDKIDYVTYIKKGFFIGSGAIESANRTVLQRRMKLPGMRWNVKTAQSVVTLSAKYRSGLWETDVVDAVHRHYEVNRSFNIDRIPSEALNETSSKRTVS